MWIPIPVIKSPVQNTPAVFAKSHVVELDLQLESEDSFPKQL